MWAGHDDDLSIVELALRFLSDVTISQMEADEHWSGWWCRALGDCSKWASFDSQHV